MRIDEEEFLGEYDDDDSSENYELDLEQSESQDQVDDGPNASKGGVKRKVMHQNSNGKSIVANLLRTFLTNVSPPNSTYDLAKHSSPARVWTLSPNRAQLKLNPKPISVPNVPSH